MTYRVSYAQNREDIIIDAFFPDVTNGFYVDVGANHPYYHSVTKIFYDKGWRGINFEPNPMLHSQLEEHRKNDENVLSGIADKKGKLKLRVYHSVDGLEGISTFSKKMKSDYSAADSEDISSYDDISVEVSTLRDAFGALKPKHIHFMKVDVEGFEYEALKGNDWKKYRPELICIEANHIMNDWRPLLASAQYALVFNDGLNDYYLAEESASRASNFDYSKLFLGNDPVVTIDIRDKLQSSDNVISSLNDKVSSLELSLSKANEELARLNKVIEDITPLRKHVKKQVKHHINEYAKKRKR